MKRFLAAISLLLTMMFMLCACGGNPRGEASKGEYSLPIGEGEKQLTIYYNRSLGYDDCDVWLWYGSVAGRGYLFHECDYGAKMVVNVPESIEEVGFIIRTGCSEPGGTSWGVCNKDGTDSDRSVKLNGRETVIYTKAGDGKSYTSSDGGVTLEEMKSIMLADLQTQTRIKYVLSAGMKLELSDITLKDAEGNAVELKKIETNYSNGIIETALPLDITKQYTLSIATLDPVSVVPKSYFDSEEFKAQYVYDGKLGVELTASQTIFRLWAPTASEVKLNLFAAGNGGAAEKTVALVKGEKGVWSHTENAVLSGKYYTYTVTTSAGKQEAVDPYAVSAGLNGNRGMILDLAEASPSDWSSVPFDPVGVENYTDAQIWEVHIRDFSNKIANSKYKGKYLAFTETGLKNEAGISVGVDYIKQLGITHVHLLPAFDYASVDESKNTQFNWGYDPKNYNVPEGSYSTDPSDGKTRVLEFRKMVQALHEAEIGVVMDVVYNHTYDGNSNFNKIVPYYYYRFTSNGSFSNGSGCGNETASDRAMFRKFMVDSVKHWQTEYNVDGFRFDLMALHDVTTMQQIEKAVHAVNPKALLYGEGWTGGTSELEVGSQSKLSNLQNVNAESKVNGIAMFNDVIRDAVKGSVFDAKDVGFATGAKAETLPSLKFGVNGSVADSSFGASATGGWEAYNPTNVINYVSAHDNNTLWDRICYVYGEKQETLSDRMRRNALSAAIVQTSLGVPFMQAGEEMLRAKKNADGTYNENSYNSPDSVNNIDWSKLKSDSPQYVMMNYYKGLIAFRKSCETLRLASSEGVCALVSEKGAFVAFTMTHPSSGEQLLVVYNAEEENKTLSLPAGSWDLYVNASRAGDTAIESGLSGSQTIEKLACYVFKKAQ